MEVWTDDCVCIRDFIFAMVTVQTLLYGCAKSWNFPMYGSMGCHSLLWQKKKCSAGFRYGLYADQSSYSLVKLFKTIH